MSHPEKPSEGEYVVTVGQGFDLTRDLWMVSTPHWKDADSPPDAGEPHFIIEGREEAMGYAQELVDARPGCVIKVYERPT
jgi:hypothetical protein